MRETLPLRPSAPVKPLTGGELAAAKATAALTALLGLLGFVNSYASVARAAGPSFGRLAPTVPVTTDLAIAVFSAIDIVLARLDMRPPWVRLVPWGLTAATIYLNVSGQASWFGRVAHAVFPSLWVVAVTLAAHVIRVRAHLAGGHAMDRIRMSRWLLAPVSTARLKRKMVLWEIRSLSAALERERERALALSAMQDRYGVLAWRWRAPRSERALFRLGLHAPVPAAQPAAPDPGQDGTATARPGIAPTPEAVARHFADQIADGRLPSGKQIRTQWPMGSARAGMLRDAVAGLVAQPGANPGTA